MRRAAARLPLAVSCTALLLAACGQVESPSSPSPFSQGSETSSGTLGQDWTYRAAPGRVQVLTLSPGWNSLSAEAMLTATNGWGPIEVNRSNGERAAGDGHTLSIRGTTFARGFGVNSLSEMSFNISKPGEGYCTSFRASVGVDDEVGGRGSVVFQVYADGELLYDSGALTGTSPVRDVAVNVAGKRELQLVVNGAGDGASYDHADWGNPEVNCEEPLRSFSFDAPDVYAPANTVRTLYLNVNISPPPTAPFSFQLKSFDPPLFFELVEPSRTYTVSTFPARIPVKMRFKSVASGADSDIQRFYPEYAGRTALNRVYLTWHVLH